MSLGRTVSLPEMFELTLGLDDPADDDALRRAVARKLRIAEQSLPALHVVKRSLDARRGRVQYHIFVTFRDDADQRLGGPPPIECKQDPGIIVVGDGPAGLFCAYRLAREGIACTVIDRGKAVQPRRRDLKMLNARGMVNPESNYCYGEGGAGTYSDGKLYTRSHKRGPIRDVMEILALHGAPPYILTEARPHIGSNLLPVVITEMRERLESCGVRFRFNCRLNDLLTEGSGAARQVVGVEVTDIETDESSQLLGRSVVLATGHSAREVFQMAAGLGLRLEPKGFALGVRIEHPQPLINEIQYGRHAGHPKLGAASYKLATQVEDRGVFSFCMCPGGWIVPAMTDGEHLVVNGMSLSKRDSPFANSGFVVGIEPEDVLHAGFTGPLAGIELQRAVERMACLVGGGENRAPAQRVTDFLERRTSSTLPDSSYLPGLAAASIDEVLGVSLLPLATKLRDALKDFEARMRGYVTHEAQLVGVESRTSSPVRIVRDHETLQSPELGGLYLCGEGPGYAGGIVSAAVDGMRVAERIALSL